MAVATPDAAKTLLHLHPDEVPAAQTALREGKIVVNDPNLVANNKVLLATPPSR